MEEEASTSSRRSTRAQAAPDWTSAETLTLLSEISAVERDCGDSVASFQKWNTVSKNIAAAGVHRSLDQCRRKWATLLEAYNKAKELGSFWNLDDDVRAEIRVSDDFDLEVFRAMDEHLTGKSEERERENEGSETDSEATENRDEEDGLIEDEEEESDFEEQKNPPILRKKRSASVTVSKPKKLYDMAKKKMKPLITPFSLTEKVEEMNLFNKQKILPATDSQSSEEEKEMKEEEEEEEEEGLAEKLLENARWIEAVVNRNLSDNSNIGEIDFIRNQGDELIAYLGKLAKSLEQLCDAVE